MRGLLRTLIAGSVIAVIAGCSDSATSPSDATTRGVLPGDRPSLDYHGHFGGFNTTTFTLTNDGGSFDIGDLYTLTVPANGVCVLTSSYGPGTWDSPCATLSHGQSIKVTATYGFSKGGPVVDFTPELRFSPAAQTTLSTMLYAPILTAFHAYYQSNPSALHFFGIYFTPDLGATSVTDAATDRSLLTHVNLNTGLVWRRIKHFSGYNVATGAVCTPSPDNPDCIDVGGPIIDGK